MMLDADVACVSPSSVYRVLSNANLLNEQGEVSTSKGQGFVQPEHPHEQWHIDIFYLNLEGTFYYLISVLDGYSRAILSHDVRANMTETDVAIVLAKARERYSGHHPRLISDNGKQFVANEFRNFVRLSGMQQTFISPYYPQSNGKIERWHQTIKRECLRPQTPLNHEDARRIVDRYVMIYNTERLHSAIDYITPANKLAGKEEAIQRKRCAKLKQAKKARAAYWHEVA